jgi:hypothetical protein
LLEASGLERPHAALSPVAAVVAVGRRSSDTPTARKVEVRSPLDHVLTPDGLARHRHPYLDAIRACNADRKPAPTRPIQFLVRRTAHHVMDSRLGGRRPGSGR